MINWVTFGPVEEMSVLFADSVSSLCCVYSDKIETTRTIL